ncbi:sensor histidine kinase [Pseudonocardia sp. GCM10023141]|uniref:sensor histidine kinase n=1 Tax=Pseudonocardia sp. GCM10023141 TaxID=3252653 RepID=UPI00360DA20F
MVSERIVSWMRGHEFLVDAVAAVVLAAGWAAFGLITSTDGAYLLLTLALLLPLAWRRRRPVGCAAVVLGVAFLQWLTVVDGYGAIPADLAVPLAIYAVAGYGPLWASRLGLAAGGLGAVLGGVKVPIVSAPLASHVLVAAFLASTVVAAWAFGALHRARRAEVATLAERARLLEVEREQRDRLAVLAERTRIAREMHDIVAHSLVVLIAQADGGRYAAAAAPDAATTALATIGDYARRALGETRRALGVLRDGPAAPGAPVPPQPGIDDVALLVEQVRAGGLDVALTLQAPPSVVEPGLGLVVYRIVQEGLTNVIKHAGPAVRAEVTVRWGPRRLEIDVLDNGTTTASTGAGGHGVLGMQERASTYGGTVTLHHRPGGGRALRARIPMPS